MSLIKFVFLLAPVIALTACDNDPVSPSSLVGTWTSAKESLSPRGSFIRELTFSQTGQYVAAVRTRGVYPSVPGDSVVSYSLTFGSYTLDGNILRLVQDSVVSWDLMTGYSKHMGPWIYIEGPPTDPVLTINRTWLIMRYKVDPGNGKYEDVERVYYRR